MTMQLQKLLNKARSRATAPAGTRQTSEQSLSSTLSACEALIPFQARLREIFPEMLKNRVQLSIDSRGHWVLIAEDGTCKAHLMMLMPRIRNILSRFDLSREALLIPGGSQGHRDIRIVVRPASARARKQKAPPPPPIPRENAEALESLAEDCDNAELEEVLKSLAAIARQR